MTNCSLQLTGRSWPCHIWHKYVADSPPYKCVKFGDPRLHHSQEISPEAVRGGISDGFFHYNFQQEVVSDVISGLDLEQVGMDVSVKFGDSRSNGSRDIRLNHCDG